MQRRTIVSVILFGLLLSGCQEREIGQAQIPDNYMKQVEEWKQNRVESLKSPTGWLRLDGMYWLERGENSFGSGEDQDVQFPKGSIPEHAGTFVYENNRVSLIVDGGVEITHDGDAASELIMFDDEDEETLYAEHGSLEWLIIKRGDLVGVRLYNKENEKADQFTGVDSYPVDPKWNRRARYIPNPEGTTMSVVNVLGQEMDLDSPGILEFSIGDQAYTLDAVEAGDDMFIIVGDQTNQTQTYQAGRYIYVDYPEEGSEFTNIDFNKLYNPPCAFNKFTTCQLPPPQNRLNVAITAGEKRPVGWEGL